MKRLVLVLGGARSGKSRFALQVAEAEPSPRRFVATAQGLDDEMCERIATHRRERSLEWTTIEEPRAVAGVIREARGGVVLVDCVTLWLGNVMGDTPEPSSSRVSGWIDDLLDALERRKAAVVVVSNEVGLGIVPTTPLGRAFRDELGRLNQRLAEAADDVYLLVAGVPLRMK